MKGVGEGWMAAARHAALSEVRMCSALFFPLLRLRMRWGDAPAWEVVGPRTDLVLEGYWRSGNTYAGHLFRAMQPRRVEVAMHTHAVATVARGVRLGKPTLILVRDPVEAISGRLLLMPGLSARQAVYDYIRFHEGIWPLRERFLLARFDEVVADFGRVIGRVNRRFKTRFRTELPKSGAAARAATEQLPQYSALSPDEFAALREAARRAVCADRRFAQAREVFERFQLERAVPGRSGAELPRFKLQPASDSSFC